MIKPGLLAFLLMCIALPTLASAGSFQLYPGATLDSTLSRLATQASKGQQHIDIYKTTASFDKVVAFYRAMYKESKQTGGRPKRMRTAVFVVDGKHTVSLKEYRATTYIYDIRS